MVKLDRGALVLAVAVALCAAPAWAEKPEGAGKGKSGKPDKSRGEAREREPDREADRAQSREKSQDREGERRERHFDERQRNLVSGYYGTQLRSGHCPPGLAKKNNGCQPPGQARKWQVGRPLPGDVIFYELPRQVLADLGPPPARHRYVRVAADILLIAIGTGMVVDAIEDLGRM